MNFFQKRPRDFFPKTDPMKFFQKSTGPLGERAQPHNFGADPKAPSLNPTPLGRPWSPVNPHALGRSVKPKSTPKPLGRPWNPSALPSPWAGPGAQVHPQAPGQALERKEQIANATQTAYKLDRPIKRRILEGQNSPSTCANICRKLQ